MYGLELVDLLPVLRSWESRRSEDIAVSADISTFTLLVTVVEIEFNSFPKWFSGCVIAVTESPENLSPLSRRPAEHQK